jgi:hypothetical protein
MPRIFVFPAGNADAQRNLEISIRSPVPAHTVLGAVEGIGDRELEQLERIRQEGPGFYAWGAQPSIDLGNEHTWQAMERGDYVLAYYGRAYHYVAQVLGKYHEPGLARAIWKEDANGRTWEYMYFLTKPTKIDAPTSWVADSLGLSNKEYRRFTRISPNKVRAVINAQGSVDNFIDGLLDRQELEPVTGTSNNRGIVARNRLQETVPPPPRARKTRGPRAFQGRDFPDRSESDSKNRDLGEKGELLVLDHEKKLLVDNGRSDLAEKVRHVSVLKGDGAGYDIESFTPEGEVKCIEVKTTRGSAGAPFFISDNEIEFSRQHRDNYHLYRVYDYEDSRNSGRFYVESGSVEESFELTPVQYQAVH